MRSPEGEDYPNVGVYLEVVPNERIVFTDAFTSAWVPSAKPFMVGTIQLDDLGDGKTRYTATVLHWTAEDREAHEKMGFHEGWGQCTDSTGGSCCRNFEFLIQFRGYSNVSMATESASSSRVQRGGRHRCSAA